MSVLDRMEDGERELKVGIERHPEALFFSGTVRADVVSLVCDDCGYLHLFVQDREKIRRVAESRGTVNYLEQERGADGDL